MNQTTTVSQTQSLAKARRGFTLVELAVVIVIIGVLAAFGVPRFIKSVGRSKAAEAFSYSSAVRAAQERYHSREGTYASTIDELNINFSPPQVLHRRHDRCGRDRLSPGLMNADVDACRCAGRLW